MALIRYTESSWGRGMRNSLENQEDISSFSTTGCIKAAKFLSRLSTAMPRTKARKAVARHDAFWSCIQECKAAAAQKRYPEAAVVVCRETQLEKKPPAKIAKQKPSENLLQSFVMLLFLGVASYTLLQILKH